MILGFSNDDMVEVGHAVILASIIATYVRVELQKGKIDRLQEGFKACKDRLADLEKTINKNGRMKT